MTGQEVDGSGGGHVGHVGGTIVGGQVGGGTVGGHIWHEFSTGVRESGGKFNVCKCVHEIAWYIQCVL